MKITCILIDDEPHARRYLSDLLKQEAELVLEGEFKNGREGLEYMAGNEPDLIVLDIHMPGMDGLTLAKLLKGKKSLVIFTTAFNHHAVEAFKVEAFDYLLKPFDQDRFNSVLERAKAHLSTLRQANLNQKMKQLFHDFDSKQSPHLTQLEFKEKGMHKTINVSEVDCFEASSVYVVVHTDKKSPLYRTSLNLLEQQLAPDQFVRIHRSLIINKHRVESLQYQNNSTFRLLMKNGKTFISSRSYYNQINKMFA